MSERNEVRFVKKASGGRLEPVVPLLPGAPHIRDVPLPEQKSELRRRMRWAATVRKLVALADGPLPDGVVGYVIRSAGMDVPTMLLSRIALEPYDYDALHTTATTELMIEPFPEQAYVVALTGTPLGQTLTTIGEGREPRPMWRDRGRRHDSRRAALREAWQRARIYKWFDGAPRCEVLGRAARVRPWRYERQPLVMFG